MLVIFEHIGIGPIIKSGPTLTTDDYFRPVCVSGRKGEEVHFVVFAWSCDSDKDAAQDYGYSTEAEK